MSNDYEFIAIDLSSLAFRSYYGLPDSLKSIDGKPVNAIKGYLDALNRFITKYHPKSVIHALDLDWRPEWRVDLLPQYKAHRVEENEEELVPDDLDFQLEVLPEILSDLGMQVIGKEKAEADDVLATLAKNIENLLVITGDRDLIQLIDDSRNIAVHMLGKDGGTLLTESKVIEKYGVESKQYIDYSVLRGDTSDGLPGVKGIGEKTASKLLNNYGTISGILQQLNNPNTEISAKIIESISKSLSYIENAIQVVTLKSDLVLQPDYKLLTFDLNLLKDKYKNLKIDSQLDTYVKISKSSS